MAKEKDHLEWDRTCLILSGLVGKVAWEFHPYKAEEQKKRHKSIAVPREIQLAELLPPGKERTEVLAKLMKLRNWNGESSN
jgi:hypothetical protein